MSSNKSVDPIFKEFKSKNKAFLKEHAKQPLQQKMHLENYSEEGEGVGEDTMTKLIPVTKIKVGWDEEETKKGSWDQGKSTQSKTQNLIASQNESEVSESGQKSSCTQLLEAPRNAKVEAILAKKPLRERIGSLLLPEQQLPISFNHHQLLKRMELIDRTIDFLANHRSMKVYFFETIKKNIFETTNTLIEQRNLEQLLFLDDKCFRIQWRMNDRIHKYDLKIDNPQASSMDTRKAEMRKNIVKFILAEQQKFLISSKIQWQHKEGILKWHPKFKFQEVQIPCKSLPVHPNLKQSDMREFQDKSIAKIANPALRKLFESTKKKTQVKSISGASVADMIFSKMSSKDISARIMEDIRKKQDQLKKLDEEKRTVQTKLDKQSVQIIIQEVLLIYMSKNVSNIFKTTLIEMLQSNLRMKDELIKNLLQKIIEVSQIGFLKEIESSQKLKVLRCNKQKYESIRHYFEKSDF